MQNIIESSLPLTYPPPPPRVIKVIAELEHAKSMMHEKTKRRAQQRNTQKNIRDDSMVEEKTAFTREARHLRKDFRFLPIDTMSSVTQSNAMLQQ